MSRKKVAIIAIAGSHGLTDYGQTTYPQMRSVYALLDRLGYSYDTFSIATTSTFGQSADFGNTYEFVVVPHSSPAAFNYGDNVAGLLNGTAYVPVFALGIAAGGAGTPDWQRTCGVDTTGATTINYLRYVWRTKNLHWYGRTFKADGTYGAAVVPIATLYGDATQFWLWRKTGTNGTTYYEAQTAGGRPGLIFLLAEAFKQGHIGTPPRPMVATFDIDDFPCTAGYPVNTLADLQAAYTSMAAHGIKATWGVQADVTNWADVTADMRSYIAARTASVGGLVNFIEHDISWTSATSKANLDTNFRATVARIAAAGIQQTVDQGGYRFFPSNSFHDIALQLASPETDLLSSPGEATLQAGYGWRVVRADSPFSANNPYGEPLLEMGSQQQRSINIVASTVIAAADKYAADRSVDASVWSLCIQRCFVDSWAYGAVPYLHGSNFYQAHDSGDGWGSGLLDDLGNLVTLCAPFVRWEFGSELKSTVVKT